MVCLFGDPLLGSGDPLKLCEESFIEVLPVNPRPDVLFLVRFLVTSPRAIIPVCCLLCHLLALLLSVVVRMVFGPLYSVSCQGCDFLCWPSCRYLPLVLTLLAMAALFCVVLMVPRLVVPRLALVLVNL